MLDKIPKEIKELIDEEYFLDDIGLSKSKVFIFKDKVLKIEKSCTEADNEYVILKWLDGLLPVPKVIKFIKDNGYNYLLMTKVPGKMAVDYTYLNEPDTLIKLLADTMKKLWEIDITTCPVDNSLSKKLLYAKHNIENNLVDLDNFEESTSNNFKTPLEILNYLESNKFEEDLVFSHGDFCLPNIFFNNGRLSGLIDLGRSGICDRYNDIAICYRTISHNINNEYANKFLELLGIEIDFEKIKYFILLDELF